MRVPRWLVGLGLGALGVTVALNGQGLADGLLYVRAMLTYQPTPQYPVRRDGRYAALYDLVALSNDERRAYLATAFRDRGLNTEWLPIPDSRQGNWLLRVGPSGPVTLLVAHWDKAPDTAAYQGASDNAASVVVLLAAAETLAAQRLTRPLAFLWTGEEERGSQGAHAFLTWTQESQFQVAEIYNFDMLGRGGVAARPVSDRAGFVFMLPLLGAYVYDGRETHKTSLPRPLNPAIIARLRAADPTLHVARRMTALGDTNVFAAAGWPGATLSASNIYYLNRVWHSDDDRVDLIDERSLDTAYALVLALAR